MKVMKKMVALLVVASMMMAMTACSGAKKAVQEATDAFMTAVIELDIDDMADLVINEDEQQDFMEQFYIYEDNEYMEMLFEQAKFKVSEIEVDSKRGEAEVSYIITLPDAEAIADEEPEDEDEFAEVLAEVETTEIEVQLELEEDDEEWFVVNPEDLYEDLFAEVGQYCRNFGESEYIQYLDYYFWWSNSSSVLELDMITLYEYEDIDFTYYFEVYVGNQMVYTSELRDDRGHYLENYFYPSDIGLSSFDLYNTVYTMVVYDEGGAEICRLDSNNSDYQYFGN